jgi:hypothetical protein
MRDNRTYRLFPSNLSLPAAFHATTDALDKLGYREAEGVCENIKYSIRIDETREIIPKKWGEFLQLLDRYPKAHRIIAHSHWKCWKRSAAAVIVFVNPDSIDVTIESDDIAVMELLHGEVRECFHASNPTPERSPELSKRNLKKSIFLARRFDDDGATAAATLRRFLSRSGFSVIEGEGYEARAIPSKVTDRIEQQDILLALLTPGDTTWISSEAAFAHARGKYVLFLVEKGVNAAKGILGADYEHITFPKGIIEKSFSDLLYALP